MKKLVTVVMFLAAGFGALASDGGKEKPTAVVTNYSEVLSQISYPEVCREQAIEGKVIVEILVDRKGRIRKHEIIESPSEELSKAVIDAVPTLEFTPAISGGKAVSSKILIPVNFKLTY